MPGLTSTQSTVLYRDTPETKEDLPWADLPTLDLSLYQTEEGKQQLAKELIEAIRTKGFFYVKNYGISQEDVDEQFRLGQAFYDLPLSEKEKYVPDLDNGEYNGYRPAGRRVIDEKTGLKDQVETYNIPKFGFDFPHDHPAPVAEKLPEIERFAKQLHEKVLDPLHVLIARALELPEDYFLNIHSYEKKSEDHLRYMRYSPYAPDQVAHVPNGLFAGGHTDLGSITLLFRQPVAALQIKDHKTGEWKWAKPQDGTITINTCDALSFLTGGYIKSTIHRVSLPPQDQRHLHRLGLLYFARPHNDVVLKTITESPVLQREGFTQNEIEAAGHPAPKMADFVQAKQKWQQSKQRSHEGATIVPGFTGKAFAGRLHDVEICSDVRLV